MLRIALNVLPVLLLTVSLANAQIRVPTPQPSVQNASLRGKIVIPFSYVSERIEVVLEKTEMQAISRVYSDSLGNFEFNNVLPGSYEVVVRLEGFEEVRQRVELIGGAGNSTSVSIFLEKKPNVVDDLSDGYPVIDVTELNRNFPKGVLEDYQRAQEDLRKGDSIKALERLEALLKLAPDFYGAHNSLGTIYQKLERYRDAEREYIVARELNPRSVMPLVNLGSLYLQEADANRPEGGRRLFGRILDEALDVLDEAVELDPHSSTAHYLLGTAYYKSAFYEEAEANLKRALELEEHMPARGWTLANLYVRQRKWQSVLDQLDAYLTENPKATNRIQIQEVRSTVVQNLQANSR